MLSWKTCFRRLGQQIQYKSERKLMSIDDFTNVQLFNKVTRHALQIPAWLDGKKFNNKIKWNKKQTMVLNLLLVKAVI